MLAYISGMVWVDLLFSDVACSDFAQLDGAVLGGGFDRSE